MFGILSTDWILQKTTKEENGEMKYFTREKKELFNDLSSGLPWICDKKFINIIKDIVT